MLARVIDSMVLSSAIDYWVTPVVRSFCGQGIQQLDESPPLVPSRYESKAEYRMCLILAINSAAETAGMSLTLNP